MDIYKCDTCGTERELQDKRVVKVTKNDGTPARQDVETCVFCLAKGLVVGTNLTKVG